MELEQILEYIKPKNKIGTFESKPFLNLSFGLVSIDLPYLFQSHATDNEIITAVMKDQHADFDVSQFQAEETLPFLLWIKNEITKINELEERELASEPDYELLASGIHELNQFLGWNVARKYAKEFGKDPEEICKWSYEKVYLLQKMDTITHRIEKRYHEILKNKK